MKFSEGGLQADPALAYARGVIGLFWTAQAREDMPFSIITPHAQHAI